MSIIVKILILTKTICFSPKSDIKKYRLDIQIIGMMLLHNNKNTVLAMNSYLMYFLLNSMCSDCQYPIKVIYYKIL